MPDLPIPPALSCAERLELLRLDPRWPRAIGANNMLDLTIEYLRDRGLAKALGYVRHRISTAFSEHHLPALQQILAVLEAE